MSKHRRRLRVNPAYWIRSAKDIEKIFKDADIPFTLTLSAIQEYPFYRGDPNLLYTMGFRTDRWSDTNWAYEVIVGKDNKLRVVWSSADRSNWNNGAAIELTKMLKRYKWITPWPNP